MPKRPARSARPSRRSPSQALARRSEPKLLPVPEPQRALATRPARRQARKTKPKTRQAAAWQVVILQGISFSIGVGLIGGWLVQQWGDRIATLPVTPNVSVPAVPQTPVLGELIPGLQTTLESLNTNETLTVGAVLVDTETRQYVSIEGDRAFAAASTIKVPLLIAFLQAVDRGQISLTEMLTMRADLVAAEAGLLQYDPVGTQRSALEVATLMSTGSDNTATNMIIDRLGGIEAVNTIFAQWGLQHTQIENLLPDLEGTNTTSPLDMVTLLSQVEQGHLLSLKERDRLWSIMAATETRTLLPAGVGEEARVMNKTGDIGSLVGDVGVIDLANGRRYLATVLVEREVANDLAANELVREISRRAYDYWRQ